MLELLKVMWAAVSTPRASPCGSKCKQLKKVARLWYVLRVGEVSWKFRVCEIAPLFLNLDFATDLVFRRYLLLYQLLSRDKVLASCQTWRSLFFWVGASLRFCDSFHSLLKMCGFYFGCTWYSAESNAYPAFRKLLKAQALPCQYVEVKPAFLLGISSLLFAFSQSPLNLHLLRLRAKLVTLKFQKPETCFLPPCLPWPSLPVALHHLLTMHQVILCSYQKRNFHWTTGSCWLRHCSCSAGKTKLLFS